MSFPAKKCKHCGHVRTKKELEEIKKRITANALASIKKAKERGNKMGRKRTRPTAMIKHLRSQGLSYRRIAEVVGVSIGSIQRALKD
jgi:hypothetical protein